LSMFSPWSCCMVFILPFFLDSFLDMSLRRNNIIFSPLVQFFPTCDRKTCRKINGGKKNGIFSHFHIFPHGPCCLWFPFSDSYVTEVHENDIYPWLKCTFFCLYFVMNNPDNCSFNLSFFPVYFYQVPFSLSRLLEGAWTFLAPKWPSLSLVPYKWPKKSQPPLKVSILARGHLKGAQKVSVPFKSQDFHCPPLQMGRVMGFPA